MQPIQLIAMDMDGTLLNGEQAISAGNRRALLDATARGIHIVFCSGRLHDDVSCFAAEAGLPDCHMLSLNGACRAMKPHGALYDSRVLSRDALDRTLAVLDDTNATYACFQPRRVLIVNGRHPTKASNWGGHQQSADGPEYLLGRDALAKHIDEGICKIVYIEETDPLQLEAVRERLASVSGLDVTSSWSNNLELMPAGVNKGEALRDLTERLGLQAAQVMALGDYDNDLGMIRYAGVGVAMGNASENVRKAADHVTLTNNDDGFAAAIRSFAL